VLPTSSKSLTMTRIRGVPTYNKVRRGKIGMIYVSLLSEYTAQVLVVSDNTPLVNQGALIQLD